MDKRVKAAFMGLFVLMLVLLLSGATFAFFLTNITDPIGSSIIIKTDTMELIYTDVEEFNMEGISPGAKRSKRVTVYNNGRTSVNYDLLWETLTNEFSTKSDIVYYITCSSSDNKPCKGLDETVIPNSGEMIPIIRKQNIDSHVTQTYTVTIEFKETGINQDDNQGVGLHGSMTIRQSDVNTNMLRTHVANDYFWQYKSDITKVVLSDSISKPASTLKGEWDMSESNDGSVMAYLTSDNILHIQGDGELYANPNSAGFFSNFSSLTEIENLNLFNTSKVTDMSFMFNGCTNLSNLNLGETFSTDKVTTMKAMFQNCSALSSLNLNNFGTSKVTDVSFMFKNCSSLTSLDLSSFDTNNVTNMLAMFYNCSSLTSVDLSNFDTSRVTDMNRMFSNCSKLTSLNLSTFNTSKVTDMSSMFSNCSKLTSLDLGSFDTNSVTNMKKMFSGCSGLISLDLSTFNTSKVTNMYAMFYNCSSLTSLDLSNFDTSKVTDMTGMFAGCSVITSLDVSNFNTNLVTEYGQMFYYAKSGITIKVADETEQAWFNSRLNDVSLSGIVIPIRNLKINNSTTSVTVTNNRNVTLYPKSSSDTTQMCLTTNTTSDSCNWITYSESAQSFTLSSGDGDKTIYAFYKTTSGKIYKASATITLDTVAPTPVSLKAGNSGDSDYNSCDENSSFCMIIGSGNKTIDVFLNVTGEPATMCLIDGTSMDAGNTECTNWVPYSSKTTYNMYISDGETDKYLFANIRDAAGNKTQIFTRISIDTNSMEL